MSCSVSVKTDIHTKQNLIWLRDIKQITVGSTEDILEIEGNTAKN